MPIKIICKDITKIKCDFLVNPTDEAYSGTGGVDFAVHTAAGEKLRQECDLLPPLSVGEVSLTKGYQLPCRGIIHTVGPRWLDGNHQEPVLLKSCYFNALYLADKEGAESVAFPLIASGTFGFPKDKVLRIALDAIGNYLAVNDADLLVYLCIFDKKSYDIAEAQGLELYLLERFPVSEKSHRILSDEAPTENNFSIEALKYTPKSAPEKISKKKRLLFEAVEECCAMPSQILNTSEEELAQWLQKQDDNFAVTLLKLIDKKNMTDVQCYKKSNISRKTFYKINNDANYKPSKQTVLAFAIGLELSLEETEQLLRTVGFTLSHSNRFDLIIEYYISHRNYDIMEINAALFRYDQVCLGC